MAAVFFSRLLKDPSKRWALTNCQNKKIVADRIETAVDSTTRRKGLLGRDDLAAGGALIIAPTNAIHTFSMRFSIDVAFVDRTGRIVKASENVKPWRVRAAFGAFAVVELPAGTLARTGTCPSHVLTVTEVGTTHA